MGKWGFLQLNFKRIWEDVLGNEGGFQLEMEGIRSKRDDLKFYLLS
jgi:hypothetical protein